MPNIKSAKKRMRKNERQRLFNRGVKSKLHTLSKTVLLAVGENDKVKADSLFKAFASALDKAVKKNIIHANKAARKKAFYQRKVNSLSA